MIDPDSSIMKTKVSFVVKIWQQPNEIERCKSSVLVNYVTEERESQREKNNNGFDAPPRNEVIVIESFFSILIGRRWRILVTGKAQPSVGQL